MHDLKDLDVEAYLAQHEAKELLRFVTVGSVDDGKSTLIGRLLHDTKGIYQDQLSAVKRATKKAGGEVEIDFALLTDGLRAEREQGITIDVAYRYFSTDKRKFIIADTPGHVQYTRNMATGASTAAVAIILIDARHGVLQQSRRHATIASLLGIPHLAVCVNKMDLVDYDEEVFKSIRADFDKFAETLRFQSVRFFPVSATLGVNVVHHGKETPWYDGGSLLNFLETVPVGGALTEQRFRFPVQYVLRPDLNYRGFAGQITSGTIQKGDEVEVLPGGQRSTVAGIDLYSGEIDEAFAPMSVTLRLADEIDISRGDMLVKVGEAPEVSRRFDADLVWMSETPLDPDGTYLLKHTTRMVRAQIDDVRSRLDLDALVQQPATTLALNDIGVIRLTCNQPLHLDRYEADRHTGAFIIVDALQNNTVAAGMVRTVLEDRTAADTASAEVVRSAVGPAARRARLGHTPAVIAFVGPRDDHQAGLAQALEAALFDAGAHTALIDVHAIDDTRSSALLADLAKQCVEAGLIAVLSGSPRRSQELAFLEERAGTVQVVHIATTAGNEGALTLDPSDEEGAAATLKAHLRSLGVLR